MSKSIDVIRKYAEYFLTNNSEVMEAEDLAELKQALTTPVDTIELISHKFEDGSYIVRLLDAGMPVYICIERGMIFVDRHEPAVMSKLILTEDYEPDESYDTTDAADYYSSSKYADWIVSGLLNVVNSKLCIDNRQVTEANNVRSALYYCSKNPGAAITISVIPDNKPDLAVTAHLYDTACLVQSLDAALQEFIDEQ